MTDLSQWQQPHVIQQALRKRSIAVVGLSSNDLRPSHFVGFYMQRHGYKITPVNPREEEILGEKCYPTLRDIPHPIDVVDVFRDPSAVPEIAQDSVAIGASFMWLQFGVISPSGVAIAEEGGLHCIVDRCLKIEHARFQGRMHMLGFNTNQISAQRKNF